MHGLRATIFMVSLLALAFLLPTQLFAADSGSPAPGSLSCAIPTQQASKDAVKLDGTAVILVTSNVDKGGVTNQDVDVIVRLHERNGPFYFFRFHLFTPMNSLTNAERACRIFNPTDTKDPAVQVTVEAFNEEIRTALALNNNAKFFLVSEVQPDGTDDTSRSIYNDEPDEPSLIIPGSTNNIPNGPPFFEPPDGPAGDHGGSMADFTIYAKTVN